MNITQKSASKYVIFLGLIVALLGCANQQYNQNPYNNPGRPVKIVTPGWAPIYDNANNVRYYYFPDYQIYYDVWSEDFVYLENGNWYFSQNLPPYYGYIDFNNAYVVALHNSVYEPWLHHDIYLSHYPKYYYRTMPSMGFGNGVRGYNENGKGVFRHPHNDNNGGNNAPERNRGNRKDNKDLPDGNQDRDKKDRNGKPNNSNGFPDNNRNSGNPNNNQNGRPNTEPNNVPNGNRRLPNDNNSPNGNANNFPTRNNENVKNKNAGNEPVTNGGSRNPQEVRYNLPTIGQPVEVKPDMRDPGDPRFKQRNNNGFKNRLN